MTWNNNTRIGYAKLLPVLTFNQSTGKLVIMRKFIRIALLMLLLSMAFAEPLVYQVPIQGTIDLGLPPFIERAIETAEENNAQATQMLKLG